MIVNCYSKQVLQSVLDFIFTCDKLFFGKFPVNMICLSVCYDLSKFRNFIHNQLLRHEKRKKAKARAWVRTATSLPTIQIMSSERAFSCGQPHFTSLVELSSVPGYLKLLRAFSNFEDRQFSQIKKKQCHFSTFSTYCWSSRVFRP